MVVVFDVNGTLLDTESLSPFFDSVFGGRYTVREWFTEVIQYSMATTLSGRFVEFGELATSVLKMAAARHGIDLGRGVVNQLRQRMQSLPPFPDVKGALRHLRAAGYRMAALSNSGSNTLKKQLHHAQLADYFERAISVSEVKQYKPAPEPYRGAARRLGVRTSDILMVAAHPWDLLGAAGAGCRTALIRRPGSAPLPGVTAPDLIARDLEDLANQIPTLRNATYSLKNFPFAAAGVLAGAISAGVLLQRASKRP